MNTPLKQDRASCYITSDPLILLYQSSAPVFTMVMVEPLENAMISQTRIIPL
jgi:hypothetical protein